MHKSSKTFNPLPYADFRSDTATAPTPDLFAAMMKSSLGDDVYNEDDSVKTLERYVATLCGHEAALYCASGTMTNQLAHRVHLCNPPQSAMVDIRSHVFNYEAGGISFHSQAAVYPIMPANGQYLTVEDIASRLVLDVDVHYAPTRVISLENTLNGTIMPIEEMVRIRELTSQHDIKLHLDGARLWHASIATGISMREYCSHFDSISLCLSKGIGAPIGSILVGSENLIKKARHFRLLFGGGWRQAGFLAEAALYCIKTNWPTMEGTHRQARWLERAFRQVGCHITNPVDTNMIWVDTTDAGFTVEELVAELAKVGIKISGSGFAARVVLHYQISDEVIEVFIDVLRKMASTPRMKVAVDLTRTSMREQPSSIYESDDELSPSSPAPQQLRKGHGKTEGGAEEKRLSHAFDADDGAASPVPHMPVPDEQQNNEKVHGTVETTNSKARCLFEDPHEDAKYVSPPTARRLSIDHGSSPTSTRRALPTSFSSPSGFPQDGKSRLVSAYDTRALKTALFEDMHFEEGESDGDDEDEDGNFTTIGGHCRSSRYSRRDSLLIRRTQSLDLAEIMQEQVGYEKIMDRPQTADTKKKCYELKQYKRGFKSAEQILKKFPEHGETLAMKGLFYNHLDKKEEAYEFVKKGLRHDLKSHICWHVFGLLYRSDKNYEEACKCYVNALKFDKENIQILRDLSLLQMQMRTLDGYIDTRLQLLELRPQNRQYWVALAIAYQLQGKPELGVKVLTAYEETLKDLPSTPDYEHSEMLLYHNTLLEEAGEIQQALAHLEIIENQVCDRKAIKEKRAKFLLALGQLDEAQAAYRELLAINPDNVAYFEGLRKSVGLHEDCSNTDQETKMLELFKELQKEYPRSNAAKRMPLKYATGGAFKEIADQYLRSMLRKGVPSLFVNIKTLYTDSEKEQTIEKLALGYIASLHKSKSFDHSGLAAAAAEPPTALLWTLYFLAQHFDFKRATDRALEYINSAIEHTPTLVELYMTKGRILKHAGDYQGAMEALNEARELDLQDRFINSKCTKYMLRADKLTEAEKTVVLFTRADIANPLNDLVDMQAQWFSLEAGESHMRQGQTGRALKRFHNIDKHFNDYTEDQFDFHTYCLRKMTLRAYVSLVRLEDQLRSHAYYVRAAQNAVQCYVQLYDQPNGPESEEMEGMTEAEKKKFRNKQRRAEMKAQQEAEDRKKADKTATEAIKKAGGGAAATAANGVVKVDEDPEGWKYSKTEDPLGEALKWLKPLQQLADQRIETHLMAFEVYIRKNKLLLALKALLMSHKLDPNHATLHEQLVRFALAVSKATSATPTLNSSVKAVIDQRWSTLYNNSPRNDLVSFITAFRDTLKDPKQNQGSVAHVISAAMAASLVYPDNEGKTKAEELLFSIADDEAFQKTRIQSLENVILVQRTLKSLRSLRVQEWKIKAQSWYPRATVFRS
ncbi:N-alpha-acetyltransferase 16, NatA auxiliary subunit [Mortierella claussenii]|nr:N-alpha-acetyltransferase 16, NatA auxiliary subunit [Mortierella claussenii]